MLTEENYIEKINSYTGRDWQPLFQLIPEIEKANNFGQFKEGQKINSNAMTTGYWEQSGIVGKFLKVVYDIPIIISFDWMSWEKGAKILKTEDYNYDSIDNPTKCKLITAIVRNDRFDEGYLMWAFKTNRINKLLTSLKNAVKQKSFNI